MLAFSFSGRLEMRLRGRVSCGAARNVDERRSPHDTIQRRRARISVLLVVAAGVASSSLQSTVKASDDVEEQAESSDVILPNISERSSVVIDPLRTEKA